MAAFALFTTVLAAASGVYWRQQRAAAAALARQQHEADAVLHEERQAARARQPQQQRDDFVEWVTADVLDQARVIDPNFKASDVAIDVVRMDNLNNDEWLDFFVFNNTVLFCGSGGCAMEVYVSESFDSYRKVLDLFSYSSPQASDSDVNDGMRSIIATRLNVSDNPIYTVFEWSGDEYVESRMEFCDGVMIEYCDPIIIRPVQDVAVDLGGQAAVLQAPSRDAPPVDGKWPLSEGTVVGQVDGTPWYLIDLWKGESGFARSGGR